MSEYRIVVDFNGGQGGDITPAAQQETQQSQSTQTGMSIFNFVEKGIGGFASFATAATAVAAAKNIFSHEIQRVERYTGSRQAQDVANASLSIIGMITNPIGTAINIAYEKDATRYQRQWENIGLQLYRERGGDSLNRSRSEV